ncbi:Transposase IS4 [Popillia japonica]|uniref:Transposase IS4 n=1 Tax=Popillia japonica TaxID=7064 RepID=A0AAW1IXI6_POPJA
MDELEKAVVEVSEQKLPASITIFPPDNANGEITDEDSGEEDDVCIENLPGSQLRERAELNFDEPTRLENTEDSSDEEDNFPLSHFVPLKKFKTFNWVLGQDLPQQTESWNKPCTAENNLNPIELFCLFFNNPLIANMCNFSNLYASQHNRMGNLVLIFSGYNILPRKHMYWKNSSDTKNELVRSAISRHRFRYVMQNIHCCNNNNLNADDKFAKMRPFMNALNKTILEFTPMKRLIA